MDVGVNDYHGDDTGRAAPSMPARTRLVVTKHALVNLLQPEWRRVCSQWMEESKVEKQTTRRLWRNTFKQQKQGIGDWLGSLDDS